MTRLAVRYPSVDGLNLTRATLNAVLKYPWLRQTEGKKAEKWGAYASEARELAWARGNMPAGSDAQSLEAALMDWADDVAYAVHDVEDFYRAGLIPLDRLATDRAERERFLEAQVPHVSRSPGFSEDEFRSLFHEFMAASFASSPFRGTRFDRAGLRSFTSALVDRYISAVSIGTELNQPLSIPVGIKMEVAILKRLTWHYVIDSRALVAQRYGQRQLITSLYQLLRRAAQAELDWHIFPAFFHDELATTSTPGQRVRVIADLIASMSERQVVEMHQRLTGQSLGSALDPILN